MSIKLYRFAPCIFLCFLDTVGACIFRGEWGCCPGRVGRQDGVFYGRHIMGGGNE
jgi:hypothetical protein